MNPYASPTSIDRMKGQSGWPRFIDWLCWLYPICFTVTAIGTTLLLRASSISVAPMQNEFYFEKTGESEQFWYQVTLMLILFSPIAGFFCPCLQLVSRNRPMRQRLQYLGVTIAIWHVAFLVLLIAGVPIIDFLFD